jgi:pilus assembly protein CpaF
MPSFATTETFTTDGLINPFGQLQIFMDDPEVEEVWINTPQRIYIAKNGKSEITNVVLDSTEVQNLVERLLMWSGRRLDLSNPFVDARLPDGSRLHAAIPEVTAQHWAVNIRKHIMRGKSLEELEEMGLSTRELTQFLRRCLETRKNILVSGSTGAGKTTLLNALASALPLNSRVISVEEVFELKPRLPDYVALQTRSANLQGVGEIPLRKLIKEALRMRPSHIIVGEIREAESLDLLIALNSGLPGMATIHANSAREAIAKLQTLPLLAGSNISHELIAPLVASAIDLVVHMANDAQGRRFVEEVLWVTGRVEHLKLELESVFNFEIFNEGGKPQYQNGLGTAERLFHV